MQRFRAAVAVTLSALLLTGCMAKAPDAIVNRARPVEPVTPRTLGLVTDQLNAGFNPHNAGDLTLATEIVAHYTLPSAFTPPAEPGDSARVTDSRTWQLNKALLTSAEVVSEKPFRIRYRINPSAQWGGSPPVPVEARDFRYLWKVVMNAPAIANTAGYDLITSVDSKDDGKTVDVTLRRPYGQWRTLFQNILPSQFLNDIDGISQLDNTVPYSAGPATVRSIDLERGQLTLTPNDKFVSGKRMELDSIRMQRQAKSDQIAEALRSETVQAGFMQGDSLTPTRLNAIPGVSVVYSWRPRQLSLVMNQASPLVGGADATVRRSLLSMLQVPLIAQLAASRLSTVTAGPVPAVSVPRRITVPPYMAKDFPLPGSENSDDNVAQAAETLRMAGWVRRGQRLLTPDGLNRALVIGVERGDQEAIAAATAIADQLSQNGFPAIVQYASGRTLFGRWLPQGLVDMVVSWHSTALSPITSVSSRFFCPARRDARPAPRVTGGGVLDPLASSAAGNKARIRELRERIEAAENNNGVDPETGATEAALRAELKNAPSAKAGEDADKPRQKQVLVGTRGPNVSGICDQQLNNMLLQLREVTDPVPDLREQNELALPFLQDIEVRLRSMALVLPLWQETLMEARTADIINPVPDFLSTPRMGIFYNVAQWSVQPAAKEYS